MNCIYLISIKILDNLLKLCKYDTVILFINYLIIKYHKNTKRTKFALRYVLFVLQRKDLKMTNQEFKTVISITLPVSEMLLLEEKRKILNKSRSAFISDLVINAIHENNQTEVYS